MCRMLIAVGREPFAIRPLLTHLTAMANDHTSSHELNEKGGPGSWQHPDGWGVAFLQEGTWVMEKSTVPLFSDPKVERFQNVSTTAVMMHCRKKSKGKVSLQNTHPFLDPQRQSVFCHNGDIHGPIPYAARFQPQGETDSERLFYSLLSEVEHHTVVEATQRCLTRLTRCTGTNIILSSATHTIIATKKSCWTRYHRMAIGRKRGFIIVSSEQIPELENVSWQFLESGNGIFLQHTSLDFSFFTSDAVKSENAENPLPTPLDSLPAD